MRIIVARIVPLAAVAALTLTGVAFAAQSAEYGGSTSQKVGGTPFRISLIVSHDAVTSVQLAANVEQGGGNCALDSDMSFTFGKGNAKVAHGTLSGKLTDGQGDSMTVTGRLTGKALSGSFVITATGGIQGTTVCNSGKVTFTARPSGGQVRNAKYSGTSGPGYPISFRVSPSGNAVDHLVVAFLETCHPGAGDVAPKFDFKTLTIRSGKFSGTAMDRFGSTVSDSLHISGAFFGRVAAGTVTDTSHIKSLPNCVESVSFTATAK